MDIMVSCPDFCRRVAKVAAKPQQVIKAQVLVQGRVVRGTLIAGENLEYRFLPDR